jgi:1,2-phenylacetyl-CoA epoxidase PaaB subunit
VSHVFEVFRQERKGQPFQHAGSVTAPDEAFAEIYAREQYGGDRSRWRSGSSRATRSTRSTSSRTSSR